MPDVLVVNEQPVQLVVGNQPLGAASGDLAGFYPAPTVAKVAGVTPGSEGLAILAATKPSQIIARLLPADGPGSKLDADLVTAPISRISSFGGFPLPSSSVAAVPQDPAATFSRFTLGA